MISLCENETVHKKKEDKKGLYAQRFIWILPTFFKEKGTKKVLNEDAKDWIDMIS